MSYRTDSAGHIILKRVSKHVDARRLPLGIWDFDCNDIVATWLKNPLTLKCPLLSTCEQCQRCIRK